MKNSRLVDDVKTLVSIASVNGRDSEKTCIDKISELAASLGLKTNYYGMDTQQIRVLSVLFSKRPKKAKPTCYKL